MFEIAIGTPESEAIGDVSIVEIPVSSVRAAEIGAGLNEGTAALFPEIYRKVRGMFPGGFSIYEASLSDRHLDERIIWVYDEPVRFVN